MDNKGFDYETISSVIDNCLWQQVDFGELPALDNIFKALPGEDEDRIVNVISSWATDYIDLNERLAQGFEGNLLEHSPSKECSLALLYAMTDFVYFDETGELRDKDLGLDITIEDVKDTGNLIAAESAYALSGLSYGDMDNTNPDMEKGR